MRLLDVCTLSDAAFARLLQPAALSEGAASPLVELRRLQAGFGLRPAWLQLLSEAEAETQRLQRLLRG